MKKYNVNIDRQKPSSDEILSHRDFDGLMKQFKAAPKVLPKPFYKSTWFFGSLAAAAAVVIAVLVYVNKPDVDPNSVHTNPVVNLPNTRNAGDTLNNYAFTVHNGKQKISPPLKNLDVAFSNYKINSNHGGTITHTSGSELIFPANAFVDASGNRISGNIDIRYREFRDPADIFLAGIPMQYDSAGKTIQFESGGMMEVAAFQNGKVVYLDKTKPVEVQFASNDAGTRYNVYQFDTAAGNWMYIGKDKVENKNDNNVVAPRELTQEQKIKKAAIEKQRDTAVSAAIARIILPELPKEPKHSNGNKNRFVVSFDPKEFPELNAFKDAVWEVDETNSKFDPAYYKVTWEDAKLSKGLQPGKYVYTLKAGKRVVQLDVYPVLEGKSYDNAMQIYNEKYSAYQEALLKRNEAESNTKALYENRLTQLGLSDAASLVQYSNMEANDKAKYDVMHTFTISGFGLINCDCEGSFPKEASALVNLQDENGIAFSDQVYHVDRSIFSLFSYSNLSTINLKFNPESSNLLWSVKDGQLFYADNDQFASLNTRGKVIMHPVNQTFKTPEEMKTFFHIGSDSK